MGQKLGPTCTPVPYLARHIRYSTVPGQVPTCACFKDLNPNIKLQWRYQVQDLPSHILSSFTFFSFFYGKYFSYHLHFGQLRYRTLPCVPKYLVTVQIKSFFFIMLASNLRMRNAACFALQNPSSPTKQLPQSKVSHCTFRTDCLINFSFCSQTFGSFVQHLYVSFHTQVPGTVPYLHIKIR